MEAFGFNPGNPLNYPCLVCHMPAGSSCRFPPGIFQPTIPNYYHQCREQVAGIHQLIEHGHLDGWSEDLTLYVLFYFVDDWFENPLKRQPELLKKLDPISVLTAWWNPHVWETS